MRPACRPRLQAASKPMTVASLVARSSNAARSAASQEGVSVMAFTVRFQDQQLADDAHRATPRSARAVESPSDQTGGQVHRRSRLLPGTGVRVSVDA